MSKASLKGHMERHAVWDPMILWDGRRYLLYVLSMNLEKGLELGNFFTHENTIEVFESADLANWIHLGQAFRKQHERERLCAGNPIVHEGRYWFFGSATVDQVDDQHLDQRLYLAVSDDGLSYSESERFQLEPDPIQFPHNRYHPADGRMLFAWRDPWPMFDKKTGRFYVFVCTGGERWGRPPDIAVAVSDSVDGSYELIGSAFEMPGSSAGATFNPAFWEIERVNVFEVSGKYFMTFSCWQRLVNGDQIPSDRHIAPHINDFTVYVATSDSMEGPYRIEPHLNPIVQGSDKTGFYGTTFFRDQESEWRAIGWTRESFRVEFEKLRRLSVTSKGHRTSFRITISFSRRVQHAVSRCMYRLTGGVRA